MQVENRGANLIGATAGVKANSKPDVASPFFGLIIPHLPVVTNFRKAGTPSEPATVNSAWTVTNQIIQTFLHIFNQRRATNFRSICQS